MNAENRNEMTAYEFARACTEKLVAELEAVPDMVAEWEPMQEFDSLLPTGIHWPAWPGMDSYHIPLFEKFKSDIHDAIYDENGNEIEEWEYPAYIDVACTEEEEWLWIRIYIEIGWKRHWVYTYSAQHFTAAGVERFTRNAVKAVLETNTPGLPRI